VTVQAPPHLSVTRFLAFGDSITWGEQGLVTASSLTTLPVLRPRVQFPTPDTYPGALQGLLASRYTAQTPTVANAGNPGEQVTDPTTFPRFTGLTSSGAYDVVLLMEGANDLGRVDNRTIVSGLGQMIDYARGHNLKVFLATIPPQNPRGPDGGQAAVVAPFNDQVRSLASSKGIPLADVYAAFNGDLTLIGGDGLHPTADGYHLIAQTFFSRIRDTLEATSGGTSVGRQSGVFSQVPRP
jgi:lysophospholipase L1-like esterase